MITAINLNGVSLKYMTEKGETHALSGVDLAIEQGEFVGIVGPSGSGKSTLLSLIAGLLLPTSGRVEVFGQEVRGPSSQAAYMLQQDCLLEWRTIEGNALLGLEIMGRVSAEKRRSTVNLLDEYGLGDFRQLYPRQLSGGMRQRVALVRTLATEPAICLLDEPFSALDYTSRLTLQNDVSTILRKSGKTCVLVTHDIPEAIAMCDRVIVLTNRPGRVKWNLPIELSAGEKQPLLRRRAPEFGKYFNRIWEEMELSVATEKTS
ncbi:MAG: ABC transporter ATP-binding protein [Bacillota bacterium]|nr:ABC transporter ATP-binding protein [Bacillota bacterium]